MSNEGDGGDKTVLRMPRHLPEARGDLRRPTPDSARARPVQSPPQNTRISAPTLAVPIAFAGGTLANPLLSSALPFLGFLSRVRMAEIDATPEQLRENARETITRLEESGRAGGIPVNLLQRAKLVIAAMTDDVSATIPGRRPAQLRPLTQDMFGEADGSRRFFETLKTATKNPKEHGPLLELMLVCLGLGFEGHYRTEPRGAARVATLRAEAWASLKDSQTAAPALSHRWRPVVVKDALRQRVAPLWMIVCVALAMGIALFSSFATVLTRETQEVQQRYQNSAPRARVEIKRRDIVLPVAAAAAPPAPEPVALAPVVSQKDRITEMLAQRQDSPSVAVETLGDYIVIRLGEELRFGSGGATVLGDLTPVLTPIAQMLNAEPGAIIVEGHSDNIPLSGVGVYKTNEALSAARAQAVADVLGPLLEDSARLSVLGVGPSRPLSLEDSAAARELNRRVEILLTREGRE